MNCFIGVVKVYQPSKGGAYILRHYKLQVHVYTVSEA
jgi:hypothetical protein